MDEALSRSEYPGMLASLQPSQAVNALSDRVKRIARINAEIADWLQERRKVEELYVAGLRKLLLFKTPNAQSELGVFQAPWDKVLQSVDAIAASHHLYAQRVERDVEQPLRAFHNKKEMQNLSSVSSNLAVMARELDDAQDKSEKLNKKGGKANAQKVDQAAGKLESATQQWESQAPFILETLQAVDEQRVNHLRDCLTQLQTHEVDQADRSQKSASEVLATLLEITTAQEIQNFASRVVAGRPKLEPRRTTTATSAASRPSITAPSAPSFTTPAQDDEVSDHSVPGPAEPSSTRLRSRIGTMLGRRRQSIHGTFGLSPQKSSGLGRNLGSAHGSRLSPRASSSNLQESNRRLSSLQEDAAVPEESEESKEKPAHEGTNGVTSGDGSQDIVPARGSSSILNGTPEDIFDARPTTMPAVAEKREGEAAATKDADGFTIPTATNDPITEAQKAAAAEEGNDQLFKLNIQNQPIVEEDAAAKQAAMSNVANTLTQMAAPTRKTGTVRGRRDVRNSVYMPTLDQLESTTSETATTPPSPPFSRASSKPTTLAALASEASAAGTSDTQSVRSGTSLVSLAHLKHPELLEPGLNSSIIETVSATFEDGEIKTAKINGEIAFAYNHEATSTATLRETIRINNNSRLEVVGPNRIFVTNSTTSPDEFVLDVSHLSKTSPAFTYRVQAHESSPLSKHCPLLIKPSWKPLGDKLGLLLQYGLNPASTLPAPVTLANVVFVATYEGARASGCQTKPTGTHLKEKHLVYWRLGDVTLSKAGDWTKIVCRIIGAEHGEPQPGHIEARWEYAVPSGAERDAGSGVSVSRLAEGKGKGKDKTAEGDEDEEDPFADDKGPLSPEPGSGAAGSWVDVPLVRRIISGKYDAK